MTRQELLDFSADHIGDIWTVEAHQTLVVGLREIERAIIVRRGQPHFDVPYPEATRYYHPSRIDPEAAEI